MRWHRTLKALWSIRPIETRDRLKRPVLLELEELESRALLSASGATAALENQGGVHPLLTVVPQTVSPQTGPSISGYTPSQIELAYGVSSLLKGGTNGKGQTIAIVDSYYDPNLLSDVKAFNTQYGLQQFNVSGGPNLTQIASGGGAGNSVSQDPSGDWDLETSLDVEWAHAIAPEANIVLVEAPDASDPSAFGAVQYAATKVPGVSVVSMSWGDYESSAETGYDYIFQPKSTSNPGGANPGVTFVAASGDSGAGAIYPAASPYVLSVGGTSLYTTTNSSGGTVYNSEQAWSGSGGGPSSFEGYPSYQYNQPSIAQNFGYPYNVEVYNYRTGATSYYSSRMTPDVAYNADLNTGYAVYDTVPSPDYGLSGGWTEVGGTSAGAPQWSALVSLADQTRGSQNGSLDTNQVLNTLYNSLSATSPPPGPSASFVKTDASTEGSWKGVYGSQGYNVIGNTSSYPSYAQISPSGNSNYVWSSSTADPRALQDANGTSRIAATWYASKSFTVNVNLTDGQSHQLALYLLDWDNRGRSEEVDILNASTGQVLSTEIVSNFSKGEYLVWNVSGDVEIRITNKGPSNAVLSGLFLDSAPSGSGKSQYSNVFHDITTGSNGYDAGTGYDLATGLGTPIANNLVPMLANTTIPRGGLPTITGSGYGGVTGTTGGFGTTSASFSSTSFYSTSFFGFTAGGKQGGGLYAGTGSISIPPAPPGTNALSGPVAGAAPVSTANVPVGVSLTLFAPPLTSSISTAEVAGTNPAAISDNLVGNVSTLASASSSAALGSATAAVTTPSIGQANVLFGSTGWNGSALSWRMSSLGIPGEQLEQLADELSGNLDDLGPGLSDGGITSDGGDDAAGDWFDSDAPEPALIEGEGDGGTDG